jgi:hypothetical protein
MLINNHQFDVTASFLEFIMDGPSLIFSHVIINAKSVSVLFGKRLVKTAGYHFAGTVLEWKQLHSIIVSKADVAGYHNSSPHGF